MSQEGLYIQVASHGLAVGWDTNGGFAFSYFTEAALGVSGSAWATVYLDPRDLDFFDNDPNDGVLDASGALYLGGGTPIGTPAVAVQVQKNLETGDMFLSLGAGTESVFEIGAYSEGQNGWDVSTITAKDYRYQSSGVVIVTETTQSTNGYNLVNTFAVDENGNRLTPVEARPFLEGAGFEPNPINGSVFQVFNRDGSSVTQNDSCFGGETPIDMWPVDPRLKPGSTGIYDQDEVRAKVWKKPIELIEVGDIVVSFDDNDNLVPGPVTRTFQNAAKILLDFHGTRVTPGHVYYRADSKKTDKYETLIDVLRDDGVIKHQDGTLIRAATNVPVDSPRDGFVQAITQVRKADGTVVQNDAGRIRLGTRFLVGTGKERKSWAVADLIEAGDGVVGDDELIRVGDGPGVPFHWDFGDTLPKPEDFVLACSGTTLEDIYKAAEWESQGPRLPAPMVLDRGPVQPLKGAALSAMPRNEPLDVVHSPMASAKSQRTLNRKQRKAMEAKQRKAAKSRKRIAV
ncbi:hypothetical protein [Phaeobacter sp. B1627]|uniref:hypothetical protein n=1 Tax=Phaeobacter sp. B1627 TaxID=2583809 RepID=UPI002106C727|nr:hypothetical protein [Phaeobacter sp. B1627]